jgi:hypothetical protein
LDEIELVVLRDRLRILGATADEQDRVLRVASNELNAWQNPITADRLNTILSLTEKTRSQVERILSEAKESKITPEDLRNASVSLGHFMNELKPWTDRVVSSEGMPHYMYKEAIERVWFRLNKLAMPRDPQVLAYLEKHPMPSSDLRKLYELLHAEFSARDQFDWKAGGELVKKVDAYISVVKKAVKSPKDDNEIMPSTPSTYSTPPESKEPAKDEKPRDSQGTKSTDQPKS